MGIETGGQSLKVELRTCQGTWIGCGKEMMRGIQGTQEPLEEIWADLGRQSRVLFWTW